MHWSRVSGSCAFSLVGEKLLGLKRIRTTNPEETIKALISVSLRLRELRDQPFARVMPQLFHLERYLQEAFLFCVSASLHVFIGMPGVA